MRRPKVEYIPELSTAMKTDLENRKRIFLKENTLVKTQRASIILLAAVSTPIGQISKIVHLSRNQVPKWIKKFINAIPVFRYIEEEFKCTKMLHQAIDYILSDAPRSGRPSSFTEESKSLIVKTACNDPKSYGLELSHWSLEKLSQVLISENIVSKISCATLSRILSSVCVCPHKNRYWLHSTDKDEDPISYKIKVQEINGLYHTAQIIAQFDEEADLRIVSTDEMTGVQALERKYPTKFPVPGIPMQTEFEYIRHGTISFIGFLDVVTGKIFDPYLGPTRNEEDFSKALQSVIETDPDKYWVIIADNLNTHSSEALVRYVAEKIDYDSDLGTKGRNGILKNQKSRIDFLTDHSHKIRFVFTPKHCSWLNQIEIFFGIMNKQLLRRSSYSSIEELIESIKKYITQHNIVASPYRWLYNATPIGSYIGSSLQ